jgi:hypothetical protein
MWQAEACRVVSEQSLYNRQRGVRGEAELKIKQVYYEEILIMISVVITSLAVHTMADWDADAEERSNC